jgi:hypothetical protein
MLGLLKNKKAQSTAEYAIVIALVVAAAMAMQVYLKRSMQGGIKFAVDKAAKSGGTGQYEPYYLESSYNGTQYEGYTESEQMKAAGEVSRATMNKRTSREGYQKVKAVQNP